MTFANVYDLLKPQSGIRLTRFWDFLDGDSLRNWWSQSGTATFAMADVVDEGFSILTTAGFASIHFNNKRQFDNLASIYIGVFRRLTANGNIMVGFSGTTGSGNDDRAQTRDRSDQTFKDLRTSGSGTASITASDIAIDTLFHVVKVVCRSGDVKLFIDGVDKITKTTDTPDAKMQIQNVSEVVSGNSEGRYRYSEAYNT